jgi:hypothetical protein
MQISFLFPAEVADKSNRRCIPLMARHFAKKKSQCKKYREQNQRFLRREGNFCALVVRSGAESRAEIIAATLPGIVEENAVRDSLRREVIASLSCR